MTIQSKPATKKYREGWDRVFRLRVDPVLPDLGKKLGEKAAQFADKLACDAVNKEKPRT